MKKILITLTFIVACFSQQAEAQTWNEWFKQKKTQRKYLVKQIILLKIYLGYLKKGYDIAQKGLTTIGNIKDGKFNLDRDFFNSLKHVNPAIRNSAQVADIIAYQVRITHDLKELYEHCARDQNLSAEELHYLSRVFTNVMQASDASLAELLDIITDNQTEMSDDERLQRIDFVHHDMQDRYAFVQSFGNSTMLLALQRSRERHDIEVIQKNYQL